MKECVKCKIVKDLSEFDKTKTGYKGHCKDCRKAYVNNHYVKNKDYYKEKSKRNSDLADAKYDKYKESLSCSDCGLSFKGKPYLCDFHHIDSKSFNPSTLRDSEKKFKAEVEKCIPLCANCHRIRHHGAVV